MVYSERYRDTSGWAGECLRRFLLTTASGSALLLALAASATAQEMGVEQVIVSSSRITSAGFEAPTPTTILSTDDINKNAEPNVFDTIAQLPSLQGTGSSVGNNGTSNGNNGMSTFNLRGLGTIRTLELLDGQRVVPANVGGVDDTSLFPQMLIERVDVVTGGASASYGSDAVAGVVNIITDKKFEGFKANIEGGVSTYGDDINTTFQLAAGTHFLGDRAHIETAIEYSNEQGVPASHGGNGSGPDGRTWDVNPGLEVVWPDYRWSLARHCLWGKWRALQFSIWIRRRS
jgi:iron complex outermembrane receptor protein